MPALSARLIVTVTLVVSAVGIVDALFGREWDLLMVLVMVAILQLGLLIRERAHRVPVTLRPDLAGWLEDRAHRTGSPFEELLDRAVAWQRHELYGAGSAGEQEAN